MREKWIISRKLAVVLGCLFLVISSCGEPEKPPIKKMEAPSPADDDPKTEFLQVDGKLFSVPSPMEMAMLINELHEGYSEDLLSDAGTVSNYTTRFQQAFNLGVYGCDLGYALSYDQSQTALGYLKSCKKLAADLGISGSLYTDLMKQFESHMDDKNALLNFMAETFRASDAYLQENESKDISVLILTGGWIESLYFATELVKQVNHEDLVTRIGEQKNSLGNLISLLQSHKGKAGFDDLIAQLQELQDMFNQVEITYTYVPPTIDTANQVVLMNSKSSVDITEEQLNAISEKVRNIRKGLVG